jgi:enoyl-CoA hydratase/carnithine racemase
MAREKLWEQQDCYFEKDGHARIFTLNRPQVLNSYSQDIVDGLLRAVNEVKDDMEVGALILTGAGRAFSSGANVKSMAGERMARTEPSELSRIQLGADAGSRAAKAREAGKPGGGWLDREHVRYRHKRWNILREMEVPTIAAINGWAIGAGLDIAMACDILIASEGTKFGYFYTKVGWVTDMGGAWYLTRAVNTYRAMELILTGDAWDANEARLMGLVGRVVPDEELLPTAIAMAERIAGNGPYAVRMDKDLIYKATELNFRNWMDYLILPQQIQTADADIEKAHVEAARRHLADKTRYMQKGPKLEQPE